MANFIIEHWRLAVLRARLDLASQAPAVATELSSYADGRPSRLWIRRHPLAAFGLAEDAGPPRQLRVPDDLVRDIGIALAENLQDEASLWLRLTPPYGYLGAVPWEESLLSVTDVPLLRVPDRLPVIADPGQVFSMAIAVSARAGSDWAAPYLASLVAEIADTIQPLDVHIFADAGTAARLRALNVPGPQWLHVHEPRDARQVSADRSSRQVPQFRRPAQDGRRVIGAAAPGQIWADWIANGLAGRAVRVLHVVLDATWDADRPILALSPDPSEPSSPETCTFVSPDDVRLLADVIGAATLSFGSPPDGTSDIAMRMVADGVGQQRPGATIYSSVRLDPGGAALAAMHAFLAGQSPPWQPDPPVHPSLFAYLQPEQASEAQASEWPEPPPAAYREGVAAAADSPLPSAVLPDGYRVAPGADLSDYYASSDTVPSWVAASDRYIGAQLANLSSSGPAPKAVGYKQAYERGAAEALAEIQAMVARHVRPT